MNKYSMKYDFLFKNFGPVSTELIEYAKYLSKTAEFRRVEIFDQKVLVTHNIENFHLRKMLYRDLAIEPNSLEDINFANLPKQTYLYEHIDPPENTFHKIHIILRPNDKVGMMWNIPGDTETRSVLTMEMGSSYLVNTNVTHCAINLSDEDRIILTLRISTHGLVDKSIHFSI